MASRLSPTWWKEHGASSPDDAVARLVARLSPVDVETLALDDALGRVLGEAVVADRASPAADVSSMDGFSVAIGDIARGTLPVRGEVLIGGAPPEMVAGAAMRIVTGAPIPPGADLVIRREDVEDRGEEIEILDGSAHAPGDHIRRAGENIGKGDVAVGSGRLISPTVAGTLASFGRTEVAVHRRVRVGVIVTGDEVVDASETPTAFQVRDSHAAALRAMLGIVPWIDLVAVGRVRDDPEALMQTVFTLLPRVDALFLTAGVSVGPRDLVPGVLVSLDVETVFRGVAQRPGRPTLGAIGPQGQLVMGLPGNPLSVFVAARRIGVPALAHLAGLGDGAFGPTLLRVERDDGKTIPVCWHRPVRLGRDGTATLARITSSGDYAGAAPTDGFVQVAPGARAEGIVPYYPWSVS